MLRSDVRALVYEARKRVRIGDEQRRPTLLPPRVERHGCREVVTLVRG
jgi:hypothetical protein